jgi:outer membrane biosynthesis protein TonB
MRVERALDKLRRVLARREITSTTAALAIALANQPAVAASATLAATVTGAALAGGGAAAGPGAWATFMSMTKLQIGISSALAVAGAMGFALQAQSNAQQRAEATRLRQENSAIAPLREENFQLARTGADAAEMRLDDAKLSLLNDEAIALKNRLQEVARAEQVWAAQLNAAAKTLDVSKLDFAPRLKDQVRPQYPIELRTSGIGGEVLVDFFVDSNGDVHDARPVKSPVSGDPLKKIEVVRLASFMVTEPAPSGARRAPTGTIATSNGLAEAQIAQLLESSAIEAVNSWKFDAGRKGGRNVTTHMQVPVVFAVTTSEGALGTPPKSPDLTR